MLFYSGTTVCGLDPDCLCIGNSTFVDTDTGIYASYGIVIMVSFPRDRHSFCPDPSTPACSYLQVIAALNIGAGVFCIIGQCLSSR